MRLPNSEDALSNIIARGLIREVVAEFKENATVAEVLVVGTHDEIDDLVK